MQKKVKRLTKWKLVLVVGKTAAFMTMAALMFFGSSAGAQIELALQVEPARALLYETVQVSVVIRNNTGAMLTFDASQGSSRFFFEIECGKDEIIKPASREPLLFEAKIVPFESKTNVFQISSLYKMHKRAVYKIRACLDWQGTLFVSSPAEAEILKGFELGRVIAGIPGAPSALRVYILEYLSRKNGEHVYLRIEDDSAKTVYGMFNLGRIVRVRKPEMKVDEAGNIHILFQSTSMTFIHTAFTPYGVQLFTRSYSEKSRAVALINLPNGQISVSLSAAQEAAGGNIQQSVPGTSAVLQAGQLPEKPRLGRGGLFGPKPE